MKYFIHKRKKLILFLSFLLIFLSPVSGRPELSSPMEISCSDNDPSSAISRFLHANSSIFPDFITEKETTFTSHVISNRIQTRRQAGTRTILLPYEIKEHLALCLFLIVLFLSFFDLVYLSRQFIIRYIHDQDGQKNKLLYF